MTEHAAYLAFCNQRRSVKQLRTLKDACVLPKGKLERDGVTLINFGSNDYLGLSQHPALIERAADYARRYGVGVTASRLVTGNHPFYGVIESKLATGKGTETALLMNGGYQTNLTVLAALADAEVVNKPVILADRLIHNSLLQGALLSGARLIRYHHNDMDHLYTLLQKQKDEGSYCIIVTESVFGMDGDCADLASLTQLAEKYAAMLYVDEAHATGVFGANGFGFCSQYKGKIDIAMGTCGKGLGSFGSYIGCSSDIRDYLIQRCGGLIYSTALPPQVLGAIEAAMELLPTLQAERDRLQSESTRVRHALMPQGWNCGASMTQIIPILLGDEDAALGLSEALRQNGIFAPAIRPPTVPRGTSRLRLSLSAAHAVKDIDHLIAVMADQAARFAVAA
jgi:8-amino-7-oxononanoate synthase